MNKFEFKSLEHKKIDKNMNRKIDSLKEIEVPYTTKVGQGKMKIDDIQKITHNTIIPLNVDEGQLIPLVLGEEKSKVIAYGHFVVLDDGQLSFQVKDIKK